MGIRKLPDYHFWCEPCQCEYSESQAERREVDTPWGDGRWWFCPKCRARLESVQVISPQDQVILAAVTQMLVRFENQEQVPVDEIHSLLLEIGRSYERNWRYLEACLVFFNASEFVHQNNMPEIAVKTPDYQKIAYQMNVPESQYQICLLKQELMENYLSYFLPI